MNGESMRKNRRSKKQIKKKIIRKKIFVFMIFLIFCGSLFFLSKLFFHLLEESEYHKKQLEILNKKLESSEVEQLLNSEDEKKDEIINIVIDKYYKKENHKRYIKYLNKNEKLSIRSIVEAVNCNLDYNYYSHDKEADLSKGFLVLVNKYYKLSEHYVPDNLVKVESVHGDGRYINKDVYLAFIKMYNDIKKENMSIYIASPYRSYAYQKKLYNNYVSKNGVEKADTFSARAGYSEHQTGLAMDISDGKISYTNFENTDEYKWMLKNAHKYGFILRYPKGKEKQTGYMFESWHYRYVGEKVAKYIHENNITFDEYYEYFLK